MAAKRSHQRQHEALRFLHREEKLGGEKEKKKPGDSTNNPAPAALK
jgi:hypothetical protein